MNKIKVFFIKYKYIIIMIFVCLLVVDIGIAGYLFFKTELVLEVNTSDLEVEVFNSITTETPIAYYGSVFDKKFHKLKDVSDKVEVSNEVDTTILGEYEVKYKISYKKKQQEKIQKVIVSDHTSPTIELKNEQEGKTCPNQDYAEEGYNAFDNYDGDITDKVEISNGDNKIIYKVKDSSNNETTVERNVIYVDEENPTIDLKGNNPTYVVTGNKYNEPGYIANDNCAGDITANVTISGSVDINTPGTYTLTYIAKDNNNNEARTTRSIKVYNRPVNKTIVPSGKTIYLTFDDGPTVYTSDLLDTLASYNVKATFFVTSARPNYNYNITRAYNEGHAIGLHTATHNYYSIYSSVDAYFNDLNKISDMVYNLIKTRTYLIRFPGGSSNTVSRKACIGIMSTLTNEVVNRGYTYFDWNISSGDASGITDTNTIANNVIKSLGSGSTYIVLQHDTNYGSVKAVSQIIEYALNHGFTFAPLTSSSPTCHHSVNN